MRGKEGESLHKGWDVESCGSHHCGEGLEQPGGGSCEISITRVLKTMLRYVTAWALLHFQALLEELLEKTQQEAAKIEEEKHKLEETTEDIKVSRQMQLLGSWDCSPEHGLPSYLACGFFVLLFQLTFSAQESSEKLKSGFLNKFALIIEALEKQRRQAVERIEQEQATALGQVAENWAQLEHQQATLSQHQEKAWALLACTDDRIFLEVLTTSHSKGRGGRSCLLQPRGRGIEGATAMEHYTPVPSALPLPFLPHLGLLAAPF